MKIEDLKLNREQWQAVFETLDGACGLPLTASPSTKKQKPKL